MDTMDLREKLWGGLFGVIAIVAALGELFVNGVSTATVLGAVKDVSGTLVMVILLVMVVKSLMPKKYKLSFEDRLKSALDKWEADNKNMIVKKANSDGNNNYGLSMKTDITSFFTPTSEAANAGWFLRVPIIKKENYEKPGIKVLFNLNRGTFFEKRRDLTDEQKNEQLSKLSQLLYAYATKQYGEMIDTIESTGKENIMMTLTLKNPIQTNEDIGMLIDLINSMYQGCLVAANIDLSR